MKIIAKDNFDRECIADELIAENVPEYYVDTMVDALNKTYSGEDALRWFVSKPDDYVLWKGMEELV